jgi:hypothetical protein
MGCDDEIASMVFVVRGADKDDDFVYVFGRWFALLASVATTGTDLPPRTTCTLRAASILSTEHTPTEAPTTAINCTQSHPLPIPKTPLCTLMELNQHF